MTATDSVALRRMLGATPEQLFQQEEIAARKILHAHNYKIIPVLIMENDMELVISAAGCVVRLSRGLVTAPVLGDPFKRGAWRHD